MENNNQQKQLNRIGTMMISYAIISVVMFFMRGWNIFDIILFVGNALNFILFQFTNIDKKIISLICIVIGFASLFLLKGIIFIFGLLLGIYGIITLIKLK